MIMRREILKVKNKKLIPNSFYRTWKMYDGLEKGVRMREMSKKEVMIEALYRIVDKLSPKDRLETFTDLAKIWQRFSNIEVTDEEDSDEMNAISEVVGSYCHECGGNCKKVTDEKHGEDFIICDGDKNCRYRRLETEGIDHFVKEVKKVDV